MASPSSSADSISEEDKEQIKNQLSATIIAQLRQSGITPEQYLANVQAAVTLDDSDESDESDTEPDPNPKKQRTEQAPKIEQVDLATLGQDGFCGLIIACERQRLVTMSVVASMVDHAVTGFPDDLVREAVAASHPEDDQTVEKFYQQEAAKLAAKVEGLDSTKPPEDSDDDTWVEQDNAACVCDAAVGTTGIGTCIAIGVTLAVEGHQYSALRHCSGNHKAVDVLHDLREKIIALRDKKYPRSTPLSFSQARYLAVGGMLESVWYQADVLAALQGLDAVAYLTDSPEEKTKTKGAYISKSGEFSCWEYT